MGTTKLSLQDIEMILESLKYTKHTFENYQQYPSYEYKQGRIKDVSDVIAKVQAIRKEIKS